MARAAVHLKISQADRAAIIAARAAGDLAKVIAARFNCSEDWVYRLSRRAGLTRPRRPGGSILPRAGDIVAAYARGEKVEAIAARFGCHYTTVIKLAKKAGHPGRRALARGGVTAPRSCSEAVAPNRVRPA